MTTKKCKTWWGWIYVAGPIADATRICQKEAYAEGMCVTVEHVRFVYTGGAEDGVRVGLLAYPRFPEEASVLEQKALRLAEMLREELFQDSVLVQFPEETVWKSRRS